MQILKPYKPKSLETQIERRFVRRAKALGCMVLKLNVKGQRDWPDLLVLVPFGPKLLIEFKRPGEDLRETQETLHDELGAIGHRPHTFDNFDDAYKFLCDILHMSTNSRR